MQIKMHLLCSAAAAAMLGCVASAQADTLTIGLSAEPTSMDPHFHNLVPNNSFRAHIFESLIFQDERQQLRPGLAEWWEPVDDTTWRIELRKGVTFSDGTPFTAKDVVYSLCRLPNVPNSPSSFAVYQSGITEVEIEDDHTLIIKTDRVLPLLPTSLSAFGIISAAASGQTSDITHKPNECDGIDGFPATDAFNSGAVAIGTGPYKLTNFTSGDRIVVQANENYWGDAPEWSEVVFRPITSSGPRVAAILAGDVDVIENPPVQDVPRLEADPNVEVFSGLSNRAIYIFPDHERDDTPGVSGTNGVNPFKDVRVRQAISMAIDRNAIAERIMGGQSIPAAELLPPGMFGASFDFEPTAYDPEGARALLAEAGFPDGFDLVLGTPNDRYINDEQIAQAIAQFLARIGINTTIDASTASTFFSRRNQQEFSLFLAGWGAPTGEMSSPLTALVHTRNPDIGMGGTNAGRYSNPEVDALIQEALQTVDSEAREKLLQQASRMAMEDFGIIPIHYEVSSWAARGGLEVQTRADQFMTAMQVTRN